MIPYSKYTTIDNLSSYLVSVTKSNSRMSSLIHNQSASQKTTKAFPTSEEFYKRVLTDRGISSCHVTIVYLDSVLGKHMEKRISAWREISKGGDIPWHRVYAFKYKDKIIWDREKKECLIDEMISSRKNLSDKFKIVSYNILNDKTLDDRKANIINYLVEANPDICCLQEVTDDFVTEIKKNQHLKSYEIAVTDLKTNNIVILSRYTINNITLIRFNSNKQALKVTVCDQNDIEVDFIGVHLTSDYKSRSDDKRREQLFMILTHVNRSTPCFIMGDFNMTVDVVPQMNEFNDVYMISNASDTYASVSEDSDSSETVDRTPTYNPITNELAKLNSSTGSAERFDRIYYQKNNIIYLTEYLVRTDIPYSDHYPIECVFTETEQSIQEHVVNTTDNKKTSMMLIISDPEIDRIRRKYDIGYDRWMGHLNIYFGFIERSDFDSAFYKIQNMINDKYIGSPMVFDRLESLDQTKYKMLCLMPNEATKKILTDLRKDVDNILKFKSEQYNPHISLGRFHDDSWKSIKSIHHETTLDRIYFSEYGGETYVEPRRCIPIKKIGTKKQIVDMLESILNEKIVVGGSSVFADDVTIPQGSDLDLAIITNSDKKAVLKIFRKKLCFSGEVFSAEYIENQHNNYLKIKLFDETNIDLHVYAPGEKIDIFEASKTIRDMMVRLGTVKLFEEVLREIKHRFKKLGVYGQSFGYLNGISLSIMLAHLFKHSKEDLKDLPIDMIVKRFCQTFSEWSHPSPICIDTSGVKNDGSKTSSIMRVHNVTQPYENTLRSLTRSTFNVTMDALKNNLESLSDGVYPHDLLIGIRCNDANIFDSMMRYIESHMLDITLGYEAIDCDVRPISCWNIKIDPKDMHMFQGYMKIQLTKSTYTNKLEKLQTSIWRLYRNQIFRYKVVETKPKHN